MENKQDNIPSSILYKVCFYLRCIGAKGAIKQIRRFDFSHNALRFLFRIFCVSVCDFPRIDGSLKYVVILISICRNFLLSTFLRSIYLLYSRVNSLTQFLRHFKDRRFHGIVSNLSDSQIKYSISENTIGVSLSKNYRNYASISLLSQSPRSHPLYFTNVS